jgi:urea transporter
MTATTDRTTARPATLVDAFLRGAGQVIFQANSATGLFFLVGIGWGSVVAGQPQVIIGTLVGIAIATAAAMALAVDDDALKQGLFGFNGALVGAALPTLFAATPEMWALLVIGAAVSTVATLAVGTVMKTWGMPTLTFPFVLTAWILMLAAHAMQFGAAAPAAGARLPAPALVEALLKAPAQVFLIDNWVSGVFILIGLAVASRWAAGFALLGAAIGIVVPLAFGADLVTLTGGLDGFSPVLTAVALGCVFYRPGWRTALYAVFGTVFTVILQAGMGAFLAPFHVPTLTGPFVLATWIFLLPKADFAPHPHAPIAQGVIKETRK